MFYDLFYTAVLIAFAVCAFVSGSVAITINTSDYGAEEAATIVTGQKTTRMLFWPTTVILFLVLLVLGVRT